LEKIVNRVFAFLILIYGLSTPAAYGARLPVSKRIAVRQDGGAQTAEQSPDLVEANRLNAEAVALYGEGKYDKAEPPAKRALMLREKVLGAEHPLVADVLRNLAAIYLARGKNKEAKASYLRSIEISEKNAGKDSLEMVEILNRYVCLLTILEQHDEVFEVSKRLYKLNNGFEYDKSTAGVVSLLKPTYPPEAKSKRITGAVVAQVTIDETGKVIDAKILCGHPLLVQGAEHAIRNSRFKPVTVAGKPVKYKDIITYNFALGR
jgi:TonB family protein